MEELKNMIDKLKADREEQLKIEKEAHKKAVQLNTQIGKLETQLVKFQKVMEGL